MLNNPVASNSRSYIDVRFFPPPSKIFKVMWNMIENGLLLKHVWASLQRLFWGILFGGVPALILGVGLVCSRLLRRRPPWVTARPAAGTRCAGPACRRCANGRAASQGCFCQPHLVRPVDVCAQHQWRPQGAA